MATSLFVYPYRSGSKSAVSIAKGLKGKVIALENSRFRPNNKKFIVNWGATSMPDSIINTCRILNDPRKINAASNKLNFFNKCKNADDPPNIPEFTTKKEEALKWFNDNKKLIIFARTDLAGHSGKGIVKILSAEDLDKVPDGTLLVKYIPKKREFRVHVSTKHGPFVIQEKLKRLELDIEKVDFQIRNYDNGFIFAKNQLVDVPEDIKTEAKKALKVTGLDFGAVDIIYNARENKSYVLEVNSAPGLEGSTIEEYLKMIEDYREDHNA